MFWPWCFPGALIESLSVWQSLLAVVSSYTLLLMSPNSSKLTSNHTVTTLQLTFNKACCSANTLFVLLSAAAQLTCHNINRPKFLLLHWTLTLSSADRRAVHVDVAVGLRLVNVNNVWLCSYCHGWAAKMASYGKLGIFAMRRQD